MSFDLKRFGEPVVECFEVCKNYPLKGGETVKALRNISFSTGLEYYPILRAEFVMLRGPSGCGKTTLLNLIGALDSTTSGRISVLSHKINSESKDKFLSNLRLEKIGFVFQTFNLLATMSAFENVELPMMVLGKLSKKERKERAKFLLKSVGLQDRMSHLPSELSGGECQRVSIARALANEPELLLLDEATGDLDTKNKIEIMDLLLKINQEQRTTMLMVSHNPDLECYANRILYLKDGQIVKQIINTQQMPLVYEEYLEYLNIMENKTKYWHSSSSDIDQDNNPFLLQNKIKKKKKNKNKNKNENENINKNETSVIGSSSGSGSGSGSDSGSGSGSGSEFVSENDSRSEEEF
ncbi:abc transporter abch.1 [Anaeramoeba flamelloides]|uniref:Abc transporter abch.1 n=1 Tax=Anaeramoeba flamelloides TaxID=1746091 RepID=A0AAV7YIE9_9EUKA|nr:abc transporter abch.1 [Anaeramoeba flamelloides]